MLADAVCIAKTDHLETCALEIAHSLSYDGLEGPSISTCCHFQHGPNLANLSISNSGHGCACARPSACMYEPSTHYQIIPFGRGLRIIKLMEMTVGATVFLKGAWNNHVRR